MSRRLTFRVPYNFLQDLAQWTSLLNGFLAPRLEGFVSVLEYNPEGSGSVNDRAAIAAADSKAQEYGTNTPIDLGAGMTYLVSSNLTITSPIISSGSKIKPASGVTVTINGDVRAGVFKIFDISAGGSIVFGDGVPREVLAMWFGAVAGGATDNRLVVTAALASVGSVDGAVVSFPAGEFLFTLATGASNNNVPIPAGSTITIKGDPNGGTVFTAGPEAPTFAYKLFYFTGGNLTVQDVELRGPANAGPDGATNDDTVGLSCAPTTASAASVIRLKNVKTTRQFMTAVRLNGGTDTALLDMQDCDIAAYHQCVDFFRDDEVGNRLHIDKCYFHEAGLDNSIPNTSGGNGQGHHIYVHPNVNVRITNSRFDRWGQHGGTGTTAAGTVYYIHGFGSNTTEAEYFIVDNCTFIGSKGCGGVLTPSTMTFPKVSDCKFDGLVQAIAPRKGLKLTDCTFENATDDTIVQSGSNTDSTIQIENCSFVVDGTAEKFLFRTTGNTNTWLVNNISVSGPGLIRCTTALRTEIRGGSFNGGASAQSAIRMDTAFATRVIVDGVYFNTGYTLAAINTTASATGTLIVRNCDFADTVSTNTPPRAINIDAGSVTLHAGKNNYNNNTVFRLNAGTVTMRGEMGDRWGAGQASASLLVWSSCDVSRQRITGTTTIEDIHLVYAPTNTEDRPMYAFVGSIIRLVAPSSGGSWSLSAAGNIRPRTTAARQVDEVVALMLDDNLNWLEIGDTPAPLTFTASDATPSVAGAEVFSTANALATTITQFDDGFDGQNITVKVDANTTVQHNANIKLAGGVDYVGTANDTITLVRISSVWYEKARSVNG